MNSPRKKVLFLASWFPNRNDPAHGIFIKKHAKAIATLHDLFLIHVCSDPDLKEEIAADFKEENGLKILIVYYKKVTSSFPVISSMMKYRRYNKAFQYALQAMKEKGFTPELVHLNVVMPLATVALEPIKKMNLPLVVTEHWTGYMPRDGSYMGMAEHFTKKTIAAAKTITVVSSNLKNAMLQKGLNGNYVVIPNIVESKFEKSPAKISKTFVLGIVADLYDRQKNISGAIGAVKKLLKEGVDVRLRILGRGEDEEKLKDISGELFGDKIVFLGHVSSDEVAKFYNEINALLVVSHFETFSVVAAEALYSGRPVIAAECGGPEEFITEDCGMIIKRNDPEAIASAIKEMIKNYPSYDPEKINSYAKEKFDTQKVIEGFDKVYKKLE